MTSQAKSDCVAMSTLFPSVTAWMAIAAAVWVLPVPGGPEITVTGAVEARPIANCWRSLVGKGLATGLGSGRRRPLEPPEVIFGEGSVFERPGRPIHERRTVVEPGEVAGQEESRAGGDGRNGACRWRFGDGVEYHRAVQAERPSGLSDPRHHLGMPGEGTGHRAARQRPEDPLDTFFEGGGRLV